MAYHQPEVDEPFDDEAEDDMVVQKEWSRTESGIRKTGYRLGLSAGQEETLQEGFDAGYREAAQVAFAVGRLQGQISASLSLLESPNHSQDSAQQPDTTDLSSSLMELLEDCAQLCHSIPQTLQTQLWPALSHTSVPHDHSHTEARTNLHGPREQHHPSSVACQPPSDASGGGDSLRDVTDLLDAVALQDLPPIRHPTLRQCYASLLRRYRSLLPV